MTFIDICTVATTFLIIYEVLDRKLFEKIREGKSISLNATQIAPHRILLTVFKQTPSVALISEYGIRTCNQGVYTACLSCETDVAKNRQTLPIQFVGFCRIPIEIPPLERYDGVYAVINGKKYESSVFIDSTCSSKDRSE